VKAAREAQALARGVASQTLDKLKGIALTYLPGPWRFSINAAGNCTYGEVTTQGEICLDTDVPDDVGIDVVDFLGSLPLPLEITILGHGDDDLWMVFVSNGRNLKIMDVGEGVKLPRRLGKNKLRRPKEVSPKE
jgi:hypothetical protein